MSVFLAYMKISIYNINSVNFNGNFTNNSSTSSKSEQQKDITNVCYKPVSLYRPIDLKRFWDDIKYENAEREYFNPERGKYITQNTQAIRKLNVIDNLSFNQKKNFIELFCQETGFPDLEKIKQKAENEFEKAIRYLAKRDNFDIKFIGYDRNSSLGKCTALPGSDCDALFIIIDSKENKENWYPGAVRWELKDLINQRLLSTHASSLPEVLSDSYIKNGLNLADEAFKKADFSYEDLKRFEKNLEDNTNDFIKSAEFNIKLASFIPKDIDKRTQYYKTAMFVELFRDGIINENNFSDNFIERLKKSPLYRYSNIMKQRGLSTKLKEKHKKRMQMIKNFNSMSIEEQFSIVKDMIYFSFNLKDITHKEYFENVGMNGKNEMGNIEKMYSLILNG